MSFLVCELHVHCAQQVKDCSSRTNKEFIRMCVTYSPDFLLSQLKSKMLLANLLYFILLGLSNAQTKRQIDNNPNDFRMFENFELTRKVYINETKIVEKVQQIKVHLLKLKKIIEEYKNKTISFVDLKGSKLKSNISTEDKSTLPLYPPKMKIFSPIAEAAHNVRFSFMLKVVHPFVRRL